MKTCEELSESNRKLQEASVLYSKTVHAPASPIRPPDRPRPPTNRRIVSRPKEAILADEEGGNLTFITSEFD